MASWAIVGETVIAGADGFGLRYLDCFGPRRARGARATLLTYLPRGCRGGPWAASYLLTPSSKYSTSLGKLKKYETQRDDPGGGG